MLEILEPERAVKRKSFRALLNQNDLVRFECGTRKINFIFFCDYIRYVELIVFTSMKNYYNILCFVYLLCFFFRLQHTVFCFSKSYRKLIRLLPNIR